MFCSSDFYILELNDFQSNVIKNLQDIRNDESFFDVTIACDDKNVVKGHKVVLSASSNYLRSILRRSSVNQHTVIVSQDCTYLITVFGMPVGSCGNGSGSWFESGLTYYFNSKVKD